MNTKDIKEGQTYVCQRDDLEEWTLDKEYIEDDFKDGDASVSTKSTRLWFTENEVCTILVTKYNAGDGITKTEYNHIKKYKITDDFLILEDSKMDVLHYIQKDQVLEFKVNW